MLDYKKAYVLGLLVGGGNIANGSFKITLPFSKWGADVKRMNKIAEDILIGVNDLFVESYGITIKYGLSNGGNWSILPSKKIEISEIIQDLAELGLPTSGNLLNTATLEIAKSKLSSNTVTEDYFLTGIFDARASLTESHRRFTNDAPIVSIEIPGATRNYTLVVQLCAWLTSKGTITDQILYNHPCQHSAADPNYSGWKKGFKIRFLAKSFIAGNSFAMKAKALDINKLMNRQEIEEQQPCIERIPKRLKAVSIHKDIGSEDLPIEVRNRLFFHYHHICAVMNCPYAPIDEIQKIARQYRKYISALPRLEKGGITEMTTLYMRIVEEYLPEYEILENNRTVESCIKDESLKIYEELNSGIGYLFSPSLNGKRHVGNCQKIINDSLLERMVILSAFESGPILLLNPSLNRAALLSSVSGELNDRLINKLIKRDGIKINVI